VFLVLTLACLPSIAAAEKHIALIAGTKSHGPGDHEYEKGARLLQRCIHESKQLKDFKAEVYTDGWPKDERALDSADTILIFCDGSDHREELHPFLRGDRLEKIHRLMDKGVGLVALHYAVFVPTRRGGEDFLEWIGGYFDYENGSGPRKWYSKIQVARETVIPATPEHPLCRGLKPFEVQEEFYYNIRFRAHDPRLVPILKTPLPNEPQPQVVAWAVERKNGGRGFGFTGGHFHANWQLEQYRRMTLNALVWTAHGEVPKEGVDSAGP
jgi:type 1 glutamine amidotransferase